ncbi:MAG: helix-turn-helix domain-containing protein [Pseudomonadota bacterium]
MAHLRHELAEIDGGFGASGPACDVCPVAESAFCARLDERGQAYYRAHVCHLRFGRNTPVLTHGRPHHRLLILTHGVARLTRTIYNGCRQVLAFHYPGDIVSFGDYETIWDADLETVTACRLCSLEYEQTEALRRRSPGFDHLLLVAAQQQIKQHQLHLFNLGRTTALQRVAALLLALQSRCPAPGMADDCFAIPMGRADIADHLILQVETVSRGFAKLVQLGAIALPKPTKVRLLDRRLLQDLADGTKT